MWLLPLTLSGCSDDAADFSTPTDVRTTDGTLPSSSPITNTTAPLVALPGSPEYCQLLVDSEALGHLEAALVDAIGGDQAALPRILEAIEDLTLASRDPAASNTPSLLAAAQTLQLIHDGVVADTLSEGHFSQMQASFEQLDIEMTDSCGFSL